MGSKLPLVDDVVLNKAAIIERCWRRVRQEYRDDPSRLSDQTRQDAIVLNLERACQAAIDLAIHEYQALDLEIVRSVVERHEADFVELCAAFGVSIDPGRKLPP
jgi:uncharacterized protein YutE (UPF0331/DUF86 family)